MLVKHFKASFDEENLKFDFSIIPDPVVFPRKVEKFKMSGTSKFLVEMIKISVPKHK